MWRAHCYRPFLTLPSPAYQKNSGYLGIVLPKKTGNSKRRSRYTLPNLISVTRSPRGNQLGRKCRNQNQQGNHHHEVRPGGVQPHWQTPNEEPQRGSKERPPVPVQLPDIEPATQRSEWPDEKKKPAGCESDHDEEKHDYEQIPPNGILLRANSPAPNHQVLLCRSHSRFHVLS